MTDFPGGSCASRSPRSSEQPRFPHWLKRPLAFSGSQGHVQKLLQSGNLHTVCSEAKCPNRGECFSRGTAAFLILGSVCTRNCSFCGVESGIPPSSPDPDEPERLAEAVAAMGLDHVVITSVTRDDLPDGGASVFAAAVTSVRRRLPSSTVELLIPDLQGSADSLERVLQSRPDILNHNVETVPRLYPLIRPQADYSRSLELLKRASSRSGIKTKSGVMVGLGESQEEVLQVMRDLRQVSCAILTVGQYLRPTRDQVAVAEFVTPELFARYKAAGEELGFEQVYSGPYVRSSYRAGEFFHRS